MRTPFDIDADLDTPVSAWLKLGPLRPRFLLESVDGGERVARYSFIGFGETLDVRLSAGGLLVDGVPDAGVGPGASASAVFAALRRVLQQTPAPGGGDLGLRVPGGLFGAVSYDFIRRIERLPARGGGEDAAFVAPRSLLVFDHVSRRAALLHDGPSVEHNLLAREVRRLLAGPTPIPQTIGGGAPRIGLPTASLDRRAYCAAVERARDHIAAGDIFQLVLAAAFRGETNLHPFQVYRALRAINPSPYCYYLDLGDRQLIGSSPEALVRLEGRQATLRPIAGTRRRGGDAAADEALERELLADPKEAAEHVMLVDLARNDLGRVASTGSVRVAPYRVIERYSHVMHIVSGVRGTLADGLDAFDLFGAAFPAGTVSGAPKVRAMELIDELEPVSRGFYAGTVGYFGRGGDMDQAIAIRTLEMRDGTYTAQAGAGIVADSVPEREHDEVLAKSGALLAALDRAAEMS